VKSVRRQMRLADVLAHRQPDLTVVMENIHDPHNVSAMLRSCDAAGVKQVQMVYTVEEFPKIGKKSSASAGKWVEMRRFRTIDSCYEQLRQEGFLIYATSLGSGSRCLYDLDLTKRVAVVFGNEHRGVSDEARQKADGIFQIPMFGMIQSLNVSVACAITVFEAVRQRSAAGHYRRRKFSDEEFQTLLREWQAK
jgi:tRNA (guanosine-2'-O-)-methyltransferase